MFQSCLAQAGGGEALLASDVHNLSLSIYKNGWSLTFYETNLFDTHAFTSLHPTPSFIGRWGFAAGTRRLQ